MSTTIDFSRIRSAVDTELLARTRIVAVGAGGAYGLYEGFARSGLGHLTVIDFDTVDNTNLARQGYRPDQVGQLKVEALRDDLERINPDMEVTPIGKDLLALTEAELDETFGRADLLLFCTDSFKGQAFGNRLALRYGKPAIWAGWYERSLCAEMFFAIPGVTPACFRCAVSPRYAAQAEQNNTIAISSNSNMIWHSAMLDSMIGMLSMAILHNDTTGYEYSGWFGTHWDRNLIQFRAHPSYGTAEGSLFQRVLAPTEGRCPNFNSIWQRIEAEHPPKYATCPDCQGQGVRRNTAINA